MNRPAGRVLTLLELLQSGGTRTTAELADRLGVEARTVRRYVGHLLDLDIPVESVRGRYGGYRLAAGYRLPPLMLGDDEALAVLLGLIAGRRTGLTTAVDTAGETAAAKIRRVLPPHLARRLQAVLDSVAFTGAPDAAAAPDAATLLTVADATANLRPIAFRYTDRGGARSERTLHPYGVVAHERHWYVRGLDPARGEPRTFRLDRMTDARTLPGTFPPPTGEEASAESVLEGFATAEYRYEVTLRIHGYPEQIRTRFPAGVALIRPAGPEDPDPRTAAWHRLDIRAERLDWLPPALAALDLPFVIERPDALRDLVAAFADRLAARARAG